jgi:hypothetical protein
MEKKEGCQSGIGGSAGELSFLKEGECISKWINWYTQNII